MSLTSICNNASDNVGVSKPSSIIGNTDADAVRLLQLARRAATSIAKKASWTALVLEHEFIANGTTDYPLPSDYRSLVGDTIWERNRYWQMRGPLSPQQWQAYRFSFLGSAGIQRRWRIHVPTGGTAPTFSIDPTIAASDTSSAFVFEYVSNHWCRSATTFSLGIVSIDAAGTSYVVGDVLTLVGGTSTAASTILVTAVSTGGVITAAQVIEPGVYTVRPTSPAAVTGGSGTGAQFLTNTITFPNSTRADWAADTDVALIDEDLIELSVIWRLQARLGIAYAEEKEEYEREIDKAIARDGGAAILSLVPGSWAQVNNSYVATDPGIVLTNEVGDVLTAG